MTPAVNESAPLPIKRIRSIKGVIRCAPATQPASRFPTKTLEWNARSCQFGTMLTEPAVPHSLQTRRRAIADQGRSGGRVSSRTSIARRLHVRAEHWTLQVTWPSAIQLPGVPSGKPSVDLTCKAIADDSADSGENANYQSVAYRNSGGLLQVGAFRPASAVSH